MFLFIEIYTSKDKIQLQVHLFSTDKVFFSLIINKVDTYAVISNFTKKSFLLTLIEIYVVERLPKLKDRYVHFHRQYTYIS